MRFAGLNITYPCKQLVIPLLDELSEEAGRSARSTPSCARAIGWSGTTPMARAGAGGSGAPCRRPTSRAWCCSARAGPDRRAPMPCCAWGRSLVIVDKEAARAKASPPRLNEHFPGVARARPDLGAALRGASGLIHATPTGMAEDARDAASRGAAAALDVGVRHRPRPAGDRTLKAARAHGCDTVDGGHMNVGQAVARSSSSPAGADAARMDVFFRKLVT